MIPKTRSIKNCPVNYMILNKGEEKENYYPKDMINTKEKDDPVLTHQKNHENGDFTAST